MTNVYPEDKWVRVNDLNLHYLDWGGDTTKKPLILMHGIGGHAHMFDDFASHMTDKWHVISIDARGCGDSDWSSGGYSTQAFASDIGLFAQALGLFPFDYYGHSQGSRIGMPLGAYYGHLVDHLVLGDYGPLPDPSPSGRDTAAQRLQSGAKPKPKGFFSSKMAYDWYREQNPGWPDEQIWRTIQNTHRTNWDGILVSKTDPEISWLLGRTALKEGPFLWDCVDRISCKTLILRGETSTVLDKEQAQKMEATIPNGKGTFKELSAAGHGLHSENMEEAVQIIREFFET